MSGYLDNEPECLKELYERHIDVLRDNLLDILYKKDQEKKNVQKTFFNSFSYRVGRFITAPLRAVKRAIIRSD
jgi:hypothetical protein